MTTIAIDKHGTIAADGLSVIGNMRHRTDVKKIVVREAAAATPTASGRPARIFATTGPFAMQRALIDWFEAGHEPKHVPPGATEVSGWTLVVIDEKQAVYITSDLPYPTPFLIPHAFGSGSDYAYSLLKDGASAEHAVKVVSGFEIYTGGEIQVVNIAEVLAHKPKAATPAPVREAAE
jgi:ATP-dependent protease HslVU (ClpYQ) peptidase subunit